MPGLTVFLDHVAGLRDKMQSDCPDPVAVAVLSQMAGADGIGLHLDQNRSPALERDVRLLRQTVHCRLVLGMAPDSAMMGLVLDVKPERVVLIPETELEGPIGHELDVMGDSKSLFETVDTLQTHGISVSICIAPDPQQAKAVRQIGANWVRINAGGLKTADSVDMQTRELHHIVDTIKMASKLRLHTAVGGGLDFQLIKLFKGIPEIDEFSMGQSLVAKSVLVGMDNAVREMVQLIRDL